LLWIRVAAVLLALAGPAWAQSAPPPLTLLDVPFISQSEALCGGAAAAMVLRYWGERGLAAESFAHLVDRSAAGIRTTALIGELRQRGWDATGIAGTDETLARELARGRPVLTLIQDRPGTFHYIVVVAVAREAVVFHDPARAPMRVMSREEFEGRWRAADRWMAVIVPGARRAEVEPETGDGPPAETPCDRLVAEGVNAAQSGDLATAERRLTAALDCAPVAALRELAGVRLLQQRWTDVESLAGAAVDLDPADAHAWRLLGTSRFLQNDRLEALDAWNRASEPRIDLLRVSGLERTRQRVVEDYLGARPGGVLTATSFVRARRRLDAFPAAASSSLDYVPVPSGLAELRAVIVERHVPSGLWSYVGIGAIAAARREVEYSLPALTGGGDRLTAGWRFWPGRPRYSVAFAAPAPWGGIWSAAISSQRERFDGDRLPPAERTTADVRVSNWVTPIAHVTLRAGITDWTPAGTVGQVGVTLRLQSLDDRVQAQLSVDGWSGGSSFGIGEAALTARSSADRRGRVYVGRLNAGLATSSLPSDAWLAGDVGTTRAPLLRAHPVVADGRLRVAQMGRRLLAGSGEIQHWWVRPLARVGAAIFIDTARIDSRAIPGALGDVDAGGGLRVGVPGVSGTFRADLARGLRDGATTFSFVYEP
jgi:predicted double-glycine peptidase